MAESRRGQHFTFQLLARLILFTLIESFLVRRHRRVNVGNSLQLKQAKVC